MNLFKLAYKTIQSFGNAVNTQQMPGTPAREMEHKNLSVTLVTASHADTADINVTGKYGDVAFDRNLCDPNNTEKVALQLVSFRADPFVWSPTDRLESSVINVKLTGSIASALPSATIRLTNPSAPKTLTINSTCRASVCLQQRKFTVSTQGSMIALKILSTTVHQMLEIFVAFRQPVSLEPPNYSFSFSMNESQQLSKNVDQMTPMRFVIPGNSTQAGDYYMCFKFPGSNVTMVTVMTLTVTRCKMKNDIGGSWDHHSLETHDSSTENFITCVVDLASQNLRSASGGIAMFIGAQVYVPPNVIHFDTVFSKFDLVGNGAVFGTILAILAAYALAILLTRRADRRDALKWMVLPISDNSSSYSYTYLMSVTTGMKWDGGTKSKVFFTIYFEGGNTGIRMMQNGVYDEFPPGVTRAFIVSIPRCYGRAKAMEVWLDSSELSDDHSWFLNEVLLYDIEQHTTFFFIFNAWLSVLYGDGSLSRRTDSAPGHSITSWSRLLTQSFKKHFSDDFLWNSCTMRISKDNFTRTQRLSCCVSLLFLVMITNAMWFTVERGSSATALLGNVFIAIVNSLIEIPVSILIIFIFRRQRPAGERAGGEGLPRWTIYVAWALVFLIIVTSGFFTVLYSMEWGPEKANRWLVLFLMSSSVSLCLVQPIKVSILALKCLITSRSKESYGEMEMQLFLDEWHPEEIKAHHSWSNESSGSAPVLPTIETGSAAATVELQRRILKRRQMSSFLLDTVVHLCYVVVLLAVAYGASGGNTREAFLVKDSLEKMISMTDLDKIFGTHSFWQWVNTTLLPALYPSTWYNGRNRSTGERRFTSDLSSFRVGTPRLRQKRFKADSGVHKGALNPLDAGVEGSTQWQEDSSMYGEAWSPYTPTREEIASFASSPASWWSYSDEAPLPLGGIAEYPGSGYVATLGDSLEDAADVIAGLRRMSWVDSRTAVVFVEFCVFNANLNLFTTVTMATRFASDDDDLPSHRVRVFANPPALSSWLPACVLLVLLTLVKAARQLFHSLNRDGLAGLRCPVLWLEAAACALRLQLVAAHFQWVDAANRAISTIATGTGVFTSFQDVAFYVELLRFSTATLVFLALLRVLTIAGATVTLARLGRALAVRVRRLRGFGAICASVACGSSFLMWALLGHRLYQFRRFIGSAGVVVAAPAIPSARDLGRIAGAPMEAAARLALAFVFRLLMPMCAFVVAGGGVPWAGEAGSSEAVGASDVREYLGSVATSGKAAAVKFVTACKGRMGRRGLSDSVPFPTGGSEPDRCGAIRARVVFPLDIYHAEPEPNHATLASRNI